MKNRHITGSRKPRLMGDIRKSSYEKSDVERNKNVQTFEKLKNIIMKRLNDMLIFVLNVKKG